MKQCRKCSHFKPVTSFHKNGYRRKDGTSAARNDCKACNKKVHDEYVEQNRKELNAYMRSRYTEDEKKRIREYGLKRMYGLSIEAFDKLLKKQGDKCAICRIHKSDTPRMDVDHCHETGKIRGICCIRCNRGIGLLKDDPMILRRAIGYLEKNKKQGIKSLCDNTML